MARLGTTFNAQEHDTTQTDFSLLPTGIYKLEVMASDIKQEGGRITLAVTYNVIEPMEYKDRRIFDYIDIEHDDAAEQAKGQKKFAKLCRAIGVGSVDDSEELHYISFVAKVMNSPAGVSKAGNAYKAKNRIGDFYYNDSEPGGHAGAMPEIGILEDATAPTQPANDNKPAARPAATPAAPAAGARRPWGAK